MNASFRYICSIFFIQTIEISFGLLVKRWPRLRYLNMTSLRKKILVVTAACCLHNIAIQGGDTFDLNLQVEIINLLPLDFHP